MSVKVMITSLVAYHGGVGQLSFVLHRLTGLGILLFLVIHVVDTSTVFFFPSLYADAIAVYRSVPFMVGEIFLVFSVIYHGVKETIAGVIYRVGLALVDLDEPTRVIGRSSDWVFGPHTPYERQGDVPNAVFPCGLVHDRPSGEIRLYYWAADTSICLATASLDELLDTIVPLTG